MRSEILKFVRAACKKYRINAFYIPDGDIYCLHKNGHPIQNFTSSMFHDIPVATRLAMLQPLLKIGVNYNMGNLSNYQMEYTQKYGQRII